MKSKYAYSILRYVHDLATEEFVNIGIVFFSEESKFFGAQLTQKYGQISRVFSDVDGNHFKKVTRVLGGHLETFSKQMATELELEKHNSIKDILRKVLPPDDSSYQFSDIRYGVTENAKEELKRIFKRMCSQHEDAPTHSRDDAKVWSTFKKPFEKKGVLKNLKKISVQTTEGSMNFDHAWKNGVWNILQPISFDLSRESDITKKAELWVGKGHAYLEPKALQSHREGIKMSFLVSKPKGHRLQGSFEKATHLLKKMPFKSEVVLEEDAESFAQKISKEMHH